MTQATKQHFMSIAYDLIDFCETELSTSNMDRFFQSRDDLNITDENKKEIVLLAYEILTT